MNCPACGTKRMTAKKLWEIVNMVRWGAVDVTYWPKLYSKTRRDYGRMITALRKQGYLR